MGREGVQFPSLTPGGAAGPGPCMRPPPAPPPPPRVLKDSWGVGRIRTGCSRPPGL